LYHRLATPEVFLAPLRERLDEVALHVADEIAQVSEDLSADARMVEECMLRPWPGNVRELRREVRAAATRARTEKSSRVLLAHLRADAGRPFDSPPSSAREEQSGEGSERAPSAGRTDGRRASLLRERALSRDVCERALAEHGGNIAAAARALGLHRGQ